ncbi:MAG: thiamine pyrophosphate-dependent enzyme, partial [Actinomycetota bacterium]|nr:thiamine pyrophosphate-dependent enzyme [Actinomycetota bacterium]
VTRPYSHSSADSQTKYRSAGELAEEAGHDPLDVLERQLVAAGVLDDEAAASIRRAAADEVTRAADVALAAPRPDPRTATRHLLAEHVPAMSSAAAGTSGLGTTGMAAGEPELTATTATTEPTATATEPTATATAAAATTTTTTTTTTTAAAAATTATEPTATATEPTTTATEPTATATEPTATATEPTATATAGGNEPVVMAEAIRLTLHQLMAADERVRVFGEDVADADDELLLQVEGKGGVFGVTRGLQRRFGSARCANTPLAEANIVGRAVGQGLRGLRPVAEIQFFDYIWPAMQQLRSEAATVRWRSAGAFSCPMVVRVAIGGYLAGGAIWHSQSGESIFAHVPGLLVAFPSRAEDAVGLLRTAVAGEDPVLFLEHKHLYRQRDAADPMPAEGWSLPFGQGSVVRPGTDLTIVTWGATVRLSLAAAARLANEGAEVEIIDLRTLVPWDQALVAESLSRTSRLLVVHEDMRTAGFGAEVAAWAASACFWSLDAPVERVTALDTWVPYAPELETAVLPQIDDIVTGARRVLAS